MEPSVGRWQTLALPGSDKGGPTVTGKSLKWVLEQGGPQTPALQLSWGPGERSFHPLGAGTFHPWEVSSPGMFQKRGPGRGKPWEHDSGPCLQASPHH